MRWSVHFFHAFGLRKLSDWIVVQFFVISPVFDESAIPFLESASLLCRFSQIVDRQILRVLELKVENRSQFLFLNGRL